MGDSEPWSRFEKGAKEIFVTENDEFSSFKTPCVDVPNKTRVIKEILVEVDTIENVFLEEDTIKKAKSRFLKIDTQGCDLEVVLGAGYFLKDFVAVQIEAPVHRLYHDSHDYTQIIQTMRAKGFILGGMFPANQSFPLQMDYDCVMINQEKLDLYEEIMTTNQI